MAKSKALRKERQPGGDDFSLQSKRRLSQRAVRVSSRSCSPEQSPSPSHNKHHSKVTLADFVNLSSESRVLSSQRGIAMASLNPSASSPCSADFVCNSDQQRKRRGKAISQHAASPPAPSQYHPSLSCPTERVPYPPTTSTHCPGYGSASPTGVVTASTCATSSGSSADTASVEKQSPYCPGPSCIYREDPMSSEVAVMDLQPSSSQPPNCKRTKAGKAEMAPLPACPCCLLVLMLIVMGQLCGFSFAFVTGLCLLRMSLLVLAGVGLLLYAVLIGYQSLTRLGLVLLLFRQTAMVYSWLSMMTGAAWLLDGFVLRM
ncbi:hypothetical protein NC653_034688 [Populus alba x Populus x berolinensis]|uniref:Uncharacterized protein n=1 Tax=Populus alba x Populus x berolinensis TaxID=444605 RepID=A0AAD6LR19_9ROSI|nr:hypothetical protein NC653_034688 [Populus alba x Populus x berolinensis]